MKNMDNHYEAVRKELSKIYTHVTFVKECKFSKCSLWYVNDEMQEIYISNEADVEYIVPNYASNLVRKSYKVGTCMNRKTQDKINSFRYCIRLGLLEPTLKAFKSVTDDKMQDMLTVALRK